MQHLHAHAGGARVEVLAQPGLNGGGVAPGHHGVEEPGGGFVDVGLGEPQAQPAVPVAGGPGVELQDPGPGGPGLLGVAGEHHLLLHVQPGVGPHDPAGRLGVVGGDVVGVGARGALGRQLQHPGAQGGQHHRGRFGRRRRGVAGLLHGVQIGAHERQGLAVVEAPHLLDDDRAGHAQAQGEPAPGLLGQGVRALLHRPRVAVVDVGDAGGQPDGGGRGPQVGGLGEGVAPEGLAQPQGEVAELFGPPGQGRQLGAGEGLGRGPHPPPTGRRRRRHESSLGAIMSSPSGNRACARP